MATIPDVIWQYLRTNDSLSRAVLNEQHPELAALLNQPEINQSVINWLKGNEPWQNDYFFYTKNAIAYLQKMPNSEANTVVRSFLMHSDRGIRLEAFGYLKAAYAVEGNLSAYLQLVQEMLMDQDTGIRDQAARLISASSIPPELEHFLDRWQIVATQRGWDKSEAFEIIDRLSKDKKS